MILGLEGVWLLELTGSSGGIREYNPCVHPTWYIPLFPSYKKQSENLFCRITNICRWLCRQFWWGGCTGLVVWLKPMFTSFIGVFPASGSSLRRPWSLVPGRFGRKHHEGSFARILALVESSTVPLPSCGSF